MPNFAYEIRVVNDPKFYGNAVVFRTWDEANTAGYAKWIGWTMAEQHRVVETDAPANYRYDTATGRGLVPLTDEEKQAALLPPVVAPKARAKRGSYRDACAWIAYNDSGADGDDEGLIRDYLTTALVADVFGVTTEQVAERVAALRTKAL